jgi:hypothetical protein
MTTAVATPTPTLKRVGTKKAVKQVVALAQTYAAQQNARYQQTGSIYVDLAKRFNNTISNLPPLKQSGIRAQLVGACKDFAKKYPHVKKFEDLQLVEAGLTPMSDILIDITIQRLLDLGWVVEILKNFREVQADPIKLYEVIDGGDLVSEYPVGTKLFASWDAQHTAMVYWIIATMITKQDPKDVKVPSNIYKVKNRADIRMNFVNGNSKAGKHLLESIDLFMQMVLGVRVDGSTDPKWIEAELKQQYLEQADLFVTHDKFGNTHQPGAISRMAEIDKYTSDVIRKFCLYTTAIPTPRPIDSQEIEIMCAWFDMVKNAGIDYTDEQVMELADYVLTTFGNNWGSESSSFWADVHTAYKNWHANYYKAFPANARPSSRMSKNWNTGGTFLWAQLNKSWNQYPLPTLSNSTPFIPNAKDLY